MNKYRYSFFTAVLTATCIIFTGCGSDADNGEDAFEDGDFSTAAALFKKASEESPSSAALKYNLGVSLAKSGDHAAAMAAFEDALAIDPDDMDAAEYLAVELEKSARYDEAHRLVDKVLSRRTAGTAAYARTLNTMAKIELGLNYPELALVRLLDAQASVPEYAPTYFNLGKLYGETLGLYAKAAGHIEKFIQQAGSAIEDREEVENLLQAYLQMPSKPQTKAIPPPLNEDDPFQKGRVAYTKKKYSEAEKLFAKAEKNNPNSYFPTLFRGHTLFAAKKYKEAEECYNAASMKATSEFDPVFWRGYAAQYQDSSRALEIFSRQVIPNWPDDYRGYQRVAEIYNMLGQDNASKHGDADVCFYISKVFAAKCIEVAKAQGATIPAMESIVVLNQTRDFSALTLAR